MARKRPDGDGLVRKRKDGRWEGRIVIGHKENGAPIYKSVFAKTQKELMPKLHGAIDCYRDADLSEQGNMTLSDWIEQWLTSYAEPTLRESTVRGYRSDVLPTLPCAAFTCCSTRSWRRRCAPGSSCRIRRMVR